MGAAPALLIVFSPFPSRKDYHVKTLPGSGQFGFSRVLWGRPVQNSEYFLYWVSRMRMPGVKDESSIANGRFCGPIHSVIFRRPVLVIKSSSYFSALNVCSPMIK